jgi:hypothetical protein
MAFVKMSRVSVMRVEAALVLEAVIVLPTVMPVE